MKLLRTWIHFVCGWTASSLNSMRSVFYFIPTDPIRKTVADLGFFQDPIRSNCFSWKCKLREGTEQGDFEGLAKWPSLPHPRSNWANLESDYWKWNPTYVNEKIISACISLRMLVYTIIYVHIYISWEYTYRWTRRVWSELFEKWCGRLVEWIWKSDLLPVLRYRYNPCLCLSAFLHPPPSRPRMENRRKLVLSISRSIGGGGEVEDRSMTDNTITNYKPLRHVSGWNWPISNTIVARLDLSASGPWIVRWFLRLSTVHFSVSNQIVPRDSRVERETGGKKFIRPACFSSQISAATLLLSATRN